MIDLYEWIICKIHNTMKLPVISFLTQIMLQFIMENQEITEFASRSNIFTRTLSRIWSIGNIFKSLKAFILSIVETDDGLS